VSARDLTTRVPGAAQHGAPQARSRCTASGTLARRAFLSLLGGAAAFPLAARAQQGKQPTIGYIGGSSAANESVWTAAFVQRLRELGWVEGQNFAIAYRWAEGRSERYAEIAAEFVQRKVDVIVAPGAAVAAAKRATSVIPIVFPIAGDPVSAGLVESLARPGGNATGLSLLRTDLAGKRIELLREAVSGLRRVAILADVSSPAGTFDLREAETATGKLGLAAAMAEIRSANDIAPAFETLKGRADALYVAGGPLTNANRVRINIMAASARLPTMHVLREGVQAGGLMSYGPSLSDMHRRAGGFVDQILRGAKPADLPVEQPIKFDLVISLFTARALGITLPPTLLARADEVIE
jgi:putative ABC transport system substrate-binding protein